MPHKDPGKSKISAENQMHGSNHIGMRERNERLVLTILRQSGALPKAEIARKTGLSAQTSSVIMRSLEQDGLLEKGQKVRGKVGQPSVPMRLAREGAFFFGLKVGRRSAELILVDFLGGIRHRRRLIYPYPTPDVTLGFVATSMAEICTEMTPQDVTRIAGMGVSFPYFLWEWASVIGIDPSKMAGWRDFDIQAEIARLVDFPVYLGNDASCACGAELVFGPPNKPQDFLYIYIGFFIGGGVVLNGNLYTGASGNAGAIGPFPTRTKSGAPTQLVDVASMIGLERRLIEANEDPQILWQEPDKLQIDGEIVSDWLDEAAPAIAHAMLSAISIIDFSGIVIDGSMPESLLNKVIDRVNAHIAQADLSGLIPPKILAGSIGVDARALGAASLPLSKRFMLS